MTIRQGLYPILHYKSFIVIGTDNKFVHCFPMKNMLIRLNEIHVSVGLFLFSTDLWLIKEFNIYI